MENKNYTKLSKKTIRKELKKFEKSFKPYKEKLEQKYSKDLAEKIMVQIHVEYEKILPQTPAFKGKINIFNAVILINAKVVSFHKAMITNGKTVDDTGKILSEIYEEEFNAFPGIIKFVARKVMFSRLWLRLTRSSAKKVYDHPEGWNIDYKKGDGKTSNWYFNCKECGVIKYFKRHNVEELGRYCNFVDYLQSDIFGLGLENPKRIGGGDDVCIEYFKQGRKTVLPDNLTDIIIKEEELPIS
ncbi:MAG: hypothetical protein ACXAC7_16455 [Candidatus Hodarchaeales archaeon]|jgi:hypothetical protein